MKLGIVGAPLVAEEGKKRAREIGEAVAAFVAVVAGLGLMVAWMVWGQPHNPLVVTAVVFAIIAGLMVMGSVVMFSMDNGGLGMVGVGLFLGTALAVSNARFDGYGWNASMVIVIGAVMGAIVGGGIGWGLSKPQLARGRMPWSPIIMVCCAAAGIYYFYSQVYQDDFLKSTRTFDAAVSEGTITVTQALEHRRLAGQKAAEHDEVGLWKPKQYYRLKKEEERAVHQAANLGDLRAVLDAWFSFGVERSLLKNTMNLLHSASTHVDRDVAQGASVALGEAYLRGVGVLKNDITALSHFMNALAVSGAGDIYHPRLVTDLFTIYHEGGCRAQAQVWITLGAALYPYGKQEVTPTEKLWAQETASWIEQQRKRPSGVAAKELSDRLGTGGSCVFHSHGGGPLVVYSKSMSAGV